MKKQHHHRRWTTEELLRIAGRFLENRTTLEIAIEFETTEYAILRLVQRLRQNGIAIPRRRPGHLKGRTNKPWTQEEVEFLVRRRNEGTSIEVIANELMRSWNGCQAMVAKLRNEGVPVTMYGNGVRRLWSSDRLKEAVSTRGLALVSNTYVG